MAKFLRWMTFLVIFSLFIISNKHLETPMKIQQERISILEKAQNSTDPAILKQAEMVRIDIEKEYRDYKESEVAKKELYEILQSAWRLVSVIVLVLTIGFLSNHVNRFR